MPSAQAIVWMIIGCVGLIALLFFSGPLKFLFRAAVRGAIGAAGFAVCNALFGFLGLSVGINAVTLLIVALLGLPGFLTLYIASFTL